MNYGGFGGGSAFGAKKEEIIPAMSGPTENENLMTHGNSGR